MYLKAHEFFCASLNAIKGMLLAASSDGRLALLPVTTKVGDHMAVIGGATVPFVLRDVDAEQGIKRNRKFYLMGEVYVHGLMMGEVLEMGEMEKYHPLLIVSY